MGDEVVTGYFKSFDRALCGHHRDDDCDRRERHERHEHRDRCRRRRHCDDD